EWKRGDDPPASRRRRRSQHFHSKRRNRPDDRSPDRQGRCRRVAARPGSERQRERNRARTDGADVGGHRKSQESGGAAPGARRRHQRAYERHDAEGRIRPGTRRRSVRDRDRAAGGVTGGARWGLNRGADNGLSSGNRTSPLLIALLNGQVALATELLGKGADPNAADDYHRAALFAAIDLRHFNHEKYPALPTDGRDPLDLIKALLEKGADPNMRTDTVPVHGLMQFDASWVNFDGQPPFVRAALSGDIEVMRLLLEGGADPKIATTHGTTSLMAAAGINWIPGQTYSHTEADYVEAVKLCLERGIDVNASNSLGLTAMHGAANRGWESVIQILAVPGANLAPKDQG